MSNAKHQATWRARQRERGSRPVTLWLNQSALSRLSQVCQYTKAPRAFTLRSAIDFAFGKARDAYWQTVRQEWENQRQGRRKGVRPSAVRDS